MIEDQTLGRSPLSRAERRKRQKRRHQRRWVVETTAVVILAVVVALLLRSFVVGTYSIPSTSMVPTLMVGDHIVVDKLAYDLHGIHRSDIVVFTTPKNEHCAGPPVPDLVKRVIGLPGDTISLKDGYVYIDGKRLSEPWLPATVRDENLPGPAGTPYNLVRPFKVPTGDVYMMGDNRTMSCDSRYWGPVPESTIVGKVDMRIWPLSRIHLF
jgi:signal peptidase I